MIVGKVGSKAIGVIASAALSGLGLLAGSAAAAAPAATPAAQAWQVTVGAQSAHGAIQTMGFYPSQITIDQGDSITWNANSAEPHTVTFLSTADPCPDSALCALPQTGFDLGSSAQSTPQGGTSYDGTSYFNSGVMTTAQPGPTLPFPPSVPLVHSYTLTFPDTLAPGSYTYYCLVHGQAMVGTVVVQAAGAAYPATQAQIDAANATQIRADIHSGDALRTQARQQDRKLSTGRHPVILAGLMNDRAMLMRFVGPADPVNIGDRLTFRVASMGEPHTVTFGNPGTGCGAPPCNPEQSWNTTPTAHGNLQARYPAHNGQFTGSVRALNSGIMLGLPASVTHLPQSLSIHFTKAGTYGYICALHAYFGMVGTVHVHPRPHHHKHHHHKHH
jgi:plastocyanin